MRGQLDELREQLGGMQERPGRSDAYRDFRFLLDPLREALPTTSPRSGYSRSLRRKRRSPQFISPPFQGGD